jgi:glyoxylase-like metal-dependent hydrolase (beta-lactamase superfamily II)
LEGHSVKQKVIKLNDVTCILGKTNVGLFENHLIDTAGIDASLDLEVILITHGHADHFGWASTLKRRTQALVVAPKEDAFLIEIPEVNVRGMFSWARPPVEMTTRFFLGEACAVDRYTEDYPFEGAIVPLPLPGHTMGHTGYLCDGVLFAGDALYPKAVWERHKLPYSIDVELTRRSLNAIENTAFDWLVPSHSQVMSKDESDAQIALHLGRLAEIDALILRLLERARSTEDLIYAVLKELDVQDNLAQYWLSVTTIKGHLSGLVSTYKVVYDITDHRVYWKANE